MASTAGTERAVRLTVRLRQEVRMPVNLPNPGTPDHRNPSTRR
jgi:hypothetical protein